MLFTEYNSEKAISITQTYLGISTDSEDLNRREIDKSLSFTNKMPS